MKRIIAHWTAGSHVASALDRQHYHRLIEGDGAVIDGVHPISANAEPRKRNYAAHTLNHNTDSIGIAVCAMAGANEAPFSVGLFPITPEQWVGLINDCARLCREYEIAPDRRGLLTHAEVESTYGIRQRGKWDIRVDHNYTLQPAHVVGDWLRQRTAAVLGNATTIERPPRIKAKDLPIIRGGDAAKRLQRLLGVVPDGDIGPDTYRAIIDKVTG